MNRIILPVLCAACLGTALSFSIAQVVSNTPPETGEEPDTITATPTNPPAPNVTVTNETTSTDGKPSSTTEITSKQLRMDTEKKIAYFDGDVQVIDANFLLRANHLVVYLNQKGSGMERAEAFDDVVIVQESEERRARGQKAVYTPLDGKIVLTGNPQLEAKNGITSGDKITIDRDDNTITVEGGTRTQIDFSQPEPKPSGTNAPSPDTGTK